MESTNGQFFMILLKTFYLHFCAPEVHGGSVIIVLYKILDLRLTNILTPQVKGHTLYHLCCIIIMLSKFSNYIFLLLWKTMWRDMSQAESVESR